MIVKRGNGDFSQIYRPCRISEVVGNDRIKKIIKNGFKENNLPNTFLFHGISGTGKTTIARIIELGLNCEEGPTSEPCCECKSCRSILKRNGHAPVREINAVKIVIDEIKKLLEEMADYGFGLYGQSKRDLLLVDECHGLRKDQASLFLTYVEDAPESMYFIFCTTNPKDFLDTLKNRCVIQTEFKEVPEKEILKLLSQICEREYLIPNQKVFARILEESHGMPRNAVSKLQEAYLAGELKKKEIRFLEGTNNIVVVAPHEPTIDDENVNIIAEQLHKDLGCYAVINEKYKRDDVNLNKISELKKKGVEDEFLVPLRRFKNEIKKKGAPPLMVYVHGITNGHIRDAGCAKEKILIGYGQGEDGNKELPQRPTLAYRDLEQLEDSLTSLGLHAVGAPVKCNYCARDENNLNQLFNLQEHAGYYDPQVRSVQLEIRMADLRGDEIEAAKTGRLLAAALKPFVDVKAPTAVKTSVASASTSEPNSKPDPELVGRSLAFLKNAFKKGIYAAKLEAGEFIIHQVLKYDYELARNLKKAKKSNRTLKDLMGQLKGEDGNTPSKTWVYDAVKLAVDEKDFCGFHSYGMLGLSHKVRLTSISDPETKKQLIQKAVDKKWTVADLRSEIAKEKEKARKEKARKPAKAEKGYGFQEWAGKRINICKGCENDCIYCWAKERAYRLKQVLPGKWTQPILRQDAVDKPQRFYKTRVAFPSTHDILPTNIAPYLVVLGKLLRAGNEVLIVSKPRPDCIKRICEATQFFKDKILFRFTIGAMEDKVLSFWELNAPEYKERKECLEYAFKHGFRTSVSMEPMLDTSRIDALINALDPFVNEDIWLGTMNHLGFVKQSSKKGLTEQLALIEAGQTPERLLAIYRKYQNNPKIKWKREPWKLIEQAIEAEKKATEKKAAQIKLAEQETAPIDGSLSRKRFSGWDIVEIEKEDGTKGEAIAPVIISASRHTDMPAFYGEWLMNALKRGYLERPMPRNPDKTEYISFEKTRLIVFWTKNHEPLFMCLDEIDKMGIGYYFQYTLNNYEAEGYEPNIPPLKQRIKVFKTLSKRIGPEKVVWRFDPLILSDLISEKKLIEKVQGVMNQLSGHTRKMVISFFKAKNHAKDARNLIKKKIQCEDFDAEFGYVATKIGKMCAQNGIEVGACAGGQDLTRYGIAMNKCIDDGLMKRVFAQDERLMAFIGDGQGLKHPGQREYCECIVSRDIGGPNTCSHLCAYCYATDSEAAVKKNLERIDQSGEMLLPIIKKGSNLDHSRDGEELPN